MMMEGGSTNQFIGSRISLISKSEIRYEGTLYALDLQEATISLAKVRSFGTEERQTSRPVLPKDEIYEFIIFRGSDIKGIDVIEPPQQQQQLEDSISVDDPAILEVSNQHANKIKQPTGSPAQQQHQNQQQFQPNEKPQPHVGHQQQQAAPAQVHPQQQQHHHQNQHPRPPQQVQQPQQREHQMPPQVQQQQGGYSRYQGRGRGGIGTSSNYRGSNPRGYYRGANYHSGIPQQTKHKIQFEGEFDFEKANEELQVQLAKIKLVDGEASAPSVENEREEEEDEETTFYQKDNFFDSISCEALERQKGKSTRVDWRAERKLNAETFGISANSRGGGGYRGNNYRGNYRGNNYRGGNNYYYNNNNPRGGYRGSRGGSQIRTVYNRNQQPVENN